MRKKIIVRGPALTRSGYGEQTRFALRTLRAHEDKFDIYLMTTGWGNTSWLAEDSEERRWIDYTIGKTNVANSQPDVGPHTYDISLQVTIPNEWERMASANIGYTAGIECTKIAPVWVEKSNMMDKVIVVSNHAKHGFDNTAYEAQHKETGEVFKNFCVTTPISVVNFPVKTLEPADLEVEFDTKFNFLIVAQNGPRKNLLNTVRWFVEQFKDDPTVGLVLKVFNQNNSTMDREVTREGFIQLMDSFQGQEIQCKIYLVHGEMTDEEMIGLYTHPKIHCLMTLAHGEGYGLPLFEAACNGMPVISPEWGGQLDFLYAPVIKKKTKKVRMRPHFSRVDYDLGVVQPAAHWEGVIQPDAAWCYPKENSAKTKMAEMVKNYNQYRTMAKKLQKHILQTHSFENQSAKFVEEILNVLKEPEVGTMLQPISGITPPVTSPPVQTYE